MIIADRPLGNVLSLAPDSVPVDLEHEYRIAGIYSFGRGLIRRPTIRGSETAYATLTRLHAGQLAMSKLNAWEGALAVVPEEFAGAHVSPEYPVFDIDDRMAEPAYISHLAKWSGLWERLTPRGSMVRRKRTTPATLLAATVPLPDLPEQRRIAARLDSMYAKLTAVKAAQNQSVILRSALTDSLLSSVGEWSRLDEFLEPTSDFVDIEPAGKYNTAGILSYGRGIFARPVNEGSETSYKRYNKIHAGQLIYSKLFGWEGALAVVPREFNGFYVSHEFPTFNIRTSRADTAYVSHLARWPRLHSSLCDKTTGMGSRRQRVNPDRLLSTIVPLPSLPEQRRIADILDNVVTSAKAAETQVSHAQALRSALLNAAFSGQL